MAALMVVWSGMCWADGKVARKAGEWASKRAALKVVWLVAQWDILMAGATAYS